MMTGKNMCGADGRRLYRVGGRTVVWLFDENESDAAKLPADNLSILDEDGAEVWNLRQTTGREDVCVLLRIDGEEICFTTFNGFSARVDVRTLVLTRLPSQK